MAEGYEPQPLDNMFVVKSATATQVLALTTGLEFSYGNTQYKVGNIANIRFRIKKSNESAFTDEYRVSIGTLNSSWRPKEEQTVVTGGSQNVNWYLNKIVGNAIIGANGVISVDLADKTAKEISICATYILA